MAAGTGFLVAMRRGRRGRRRCSRRRRPALGSTLLRSARRGASPRLRSIAPRCGISRRRCKALRRAALLRHWTRHLRSGRELRRRRGRQPLRLLPNDLLRHLQYLALPAIGELAVGLVQGEPERLAHFIAHLRADLPKPPGLVEKQVKTDGLGDMLAASPGALVEVANGGEAEQQPAAYPGFFEDLAVGALLGCFPLVHAAFGQSKNRALGAGLGP